MQDEDGYITLNIKSRKPELTSVDAGSSSWWRVMALVLLVLSMGMVFGLVALGIIYHKCSPCEANWRYFENSCYGFFRRNLTWEESKQFCIDFNSTLLKADSPKVLEYLKGKTSYIRWVGLSRKNSNKVWMWEDGSVLSKTKSGLSADGTENMDCAYFHKGKLHPTLCQSRHFLMCERRAGAVKMDQLP